MTEVKHGINPKFESQMDHLDPLSDQDLIARGLVIGNTPESTAIDRLLRARASESEAKGSRDMVEATKQLVGATRPLGTVTWWLVAGTVLMGLGAGAHTAEQQRSAA